VETFGSTRVLSRVTPLASVMPKKIELLPLESTFAFLRVKGTTTLNYFEGRALWRFLLSALMMNSRGNVEVIPLFASLCQVTQKRLRRIFWSGSPWLQRQETAVNLLGLLDTSMHL